MVETESKPTFEEYLSKIGKQKGSLIPLLQSAQDEFSYIPESAVRRISEVTGKSMSDIYGVVTFYAQFRLTPLGKYVIKLCDGTACHVNNARALIDALTDELGVAPDETTPDGLFTFLTVACLGCCSLSPVMMIDETTYGKLEPKTCRKIIKDYRAGKYDKEAK